MILPGLTGNRLRRSPAICFFPVGHVLDFTDVAALFEPFELALLRRVSLQVTDRIVTCAPAPIGPTLRQHHERDVLEEEVYPASIRARISPSCGILRRSSENAAIPVSHSPFSCLVSVLAPQESASTL